MTRIKYTAMLALGFYCFTVFRCWRFPLPDLRERFYGFILSWAGFWAYRVPYREWVELTKMAEADL